MTPRCPRCGSTLTAQPHRCPEPQKVFYDTLGQLVPACSIRPSLQELYVERDRLVELSGPAGVPLEERPPDQVRALEKLHHVYVQISSAENERDLRLLGA